MLLSFFLYGEKCMRIIRNILIVLFLFFVSCATRYTPDEDIIILYTNDVHCDVDRGLGYAGVMQYKKEESEKSHNVILVDLGDAIQGENIGLISKGTAVVDIMNRVGYKFAIFGNREFDYGMENISELLERAKAKYICCNYRYTGKKFNLLEKVKPYEVVDFNGLKVKYNDFLQHFQISLNIF